MKTFSLFLLFLYGLRSMKSKWQIIHRGQVRDVAVFDNGGLASLVTLFSVLQHRGLLAYDLIE